MPDAPGSQGARARRRDRLFRQGRRHGSDEPVGRRKGAIAPGARDLFSPNMIILDEPTNHLDIDSRAALAEAINEFPGAVIMVSHDRYLIEACADQLWVVADQTVTTYDGDLDEYRRMVLSARGVRDQLRATAATSAQGNAPSRERGKKRKAHAAAAEDRRGRGRDRAHQRHHRQDRHRAGAAGSVHARSEAGRPAQQGARRRRKRAAARRGRLAGGEFAVRRGGRLNRRLLPIEAFGNDGRRGYVAAGFFFGLGFAAFGCATGSGSALDRRQAPAR